MYVSKNSYARKSAREPDDPQINKKKVHFESSGDDEEDIEAQIKEEKISEGSNLYKG